MSSDPALSQGPGLQQAPVHECALDSASSLGLCTYACWPVFLNEAFGALVATSPGQACDCLTISHMMFE